jgi:hypothetical protein
MVRSIRDAVLAGLLLAAVSTFGDFLWAALDLRHRVAYGILHGALMCLCIGAVIGWRTRRRLAGAIAGPLVGVAAAATFYVLAPMLRWQAMLPAWMLFWICFAFLQGWLSGRSRVPPIAVRGLTAAVLSGLAFYAISGIWTRPSPGGPDYLRHFLSWTFAFFPGFAALFVERPNARSNQ